MIQRIKFFLLALVLLGSIWALNKHHPFGSSLPRLGFLLSPSHGFWKQAEPQTPRKAKSIRLPKLNSEVEVVFDERMTPHIFASNLKDAAYVQGYVTASLRLWQMDLATRAASGRLSEILGEQTLEYDRIQRRKGMVTAAENELSAMKGDPVEWAVLEAYADGVNAYIQTLVPVDYPLEFKLLNYSPEPWTPLKSALMSKRMAETLCSRNSDIPATNTLRALGRESFDFLFPEYNPKQSPIIPESVPFDFQPVAPDTSAQPEPAMIGQLWRQPMMPTPPPFLGSNNWAVSGAKTASGNPILCNDPHLDLSLPSIWFEIQIHTPEVNAYGVSLPGLPGIIIGFNKDIAWGVTNVGHDVLDWYAIKWLDEQKSRYLLDDQPQKVTEVIEEIRVAGRKTPVLDTVKYTVWGPVVYDEPSSPYYDLAMRWLAHDKPTGNSFHQVGTFLRLMKARNYDDYSEALKGFDTPAQNFVFASREGDIALKVNGKLPVRQPGQGRFVQDGSFSGNQWRAFIPRDQIPQVRNPERGFVSSANQHSTSPAYPYYYLGDFDDYRGRVLNRLLEGMNGIEAKDMMALQFNSYSIMAEESMPVFLGLLEGASLDAAENEGLQLLKAWDYNYRKTDKAPLLHRALLDSAYALTFDEFFDRPDSLAMLTPELWRFIDLLANHPGHAIFDAKQTPEKENAAAIVQKAYKAAVKAWYADLKSGKTDWGKFNGADISHLLRLPAFSRLDLYTDGHNNSLNAIRQGHGPSWRMIVELGDPVKAYGVYPGGQSGNPGSPFYDNMVTQWAEGKYNVLNFMSSPSEKLPKMLSTWKFKS